MSDHKHTFKIGDRVQCINNYSYGPVKGEIYEVIKSITMENIAISLKEFLDLRDANYWWYGDFKLVTPTKRKKFFK